MNIPQTPAICEAIDLPSKNFLAQLQANAVAITGVWEDEEDEKSVEWITQEVTTTHQAILQALSQLK